VGETEAGWTEKARKLLLYSLIVYSGTDYVGNLIDAATGLVRTWTTELIRRRWFESHQFPASKSFHLVLSGVTATVGKMRSTVVNPYLPKPNGFTSATAKKMAAELEEILDIDPSDIGRSSAVDQEHNLWLVYDLSEPVPSGVEVSGYAFYRDTEMTPLILETGRAVRVVRFIGPKVSLSKVVTIFGTEETTLTPFQLSKVCYSNVNRVNPMVCGLSEYLWFRRDEVTALLRVEYLANAGLIVSLAEVLRVFDLDSSLTLNGHECETRLKGPGGEFLLFSLPVAGITQMCWHPGEYRSGRDLSVWGFRRTLSVTYTFGPSGKSVYYDFETPIFSLTVTKLFTKGSKLFSELLGKVVINIDQIGDMMVYEYGEAHGLVPGLVWCESKYEEKMSTYGYEYDPGDDVFRYLKSSDVDWLGSYGLT